jgi:Ca-activated chloride channel family protein
MLNDFLVFPEYGWWLLLLFPAGLAAVLAFSRSVSAITGWFNHGDYQFLYPLAKLVFRGMALLLIGLALVGPYWGRLPEKVNKMGREVYFLLDVSASMMTEDIKPSRLTKIKKELKKMITALKGDKMGLIVFTSDAYVQCPLTTDYKALLLFVDLVSSEQFSNTGTDFRAALSMALKRFTETEKATQKMSRSIVLISDGEDFGETYTSVTERLKSEQIMLFTVGIGTYEGGRVPNYRRGKQDGFKKNSDGTPAISQLKDESLRQLADEFGTQYHNIDQPVDDLGPIIDQVKLVSASIMDSKSEMAKVNRFQYPLLAGIVLFMVSLFWMPVSAKRNY